MRAKRNEIKQFVSLFPVVVKFTPGDNMMNIHRATKFILSYTAFLASIAIALACLVFLMIPIRTPPLVMATFPVAMVRSFLPGGGAFIGTETARVMSIVTFYNMGTNLNSLIAPFTGKEAMAALHLAFFRTAMVTVSRTWSYPHFLATNFTSFIPACRLSFSGTFVRTKTINTLAAIWELFSTCFTDLRGKSLCFMNASYRAKALCFFAWFESLFALFTRTFAQVQISPGFARAASRAKTLFFVPCRELLVTKFTLLCFHNSIISLTAKYASVEFGGYTLWLTG